MSASSFPHPHGLRSLRLGRGMLVLLIVAIAVVGGFAALGLALVSGVVLSLLVVFLVPLIAGL